jgi:hypothetical protein
MTKVLAVSSLAVLLFSSCSNSSLSNSQNTRSGNSNSNAVVNTATAPVIEPPVSPTPIVRISASDGMPVLQPSDILEVLRKYRGEHPELTVKEIAGYGNSIMPEKGFNYWIDIGALNESKEKHKEAKIISEDHYSYPYEMTLADGKKQKFRLVAPRHDSCCCGYYYADLPASHITENEITFVSEGKAYTVKRPADLGHNEVYALVDEENLTKEIRKWQVPAEGYPLGISEDGTKLYVEGAFDDIYLEISPEGSFRFIPKAEVISDKGESCPVPNNPDDAYEGCMKFKVADKVYFVRYSAPCT